MRYISGFLSFLIMTFGFCQVGAQNNSQSAPDPQYWNISPDQDAITWNISPVEKKLYIGHTAFEQEEKKYL